MIHAKELHYRPLDSDTERTEARQAELLESQRLLLSKQLYRICAKCHLSQPLTSEFYHKYSSTCSSAGKFRQTCRLCLNIETKKRNKRLREKNDPVWRERQRANMKRYRHKPNGYRNAAHKRNYWNHRSRGEHLIKNIWIKEEPSQSNIYVKGGT